MENKFSDLIDLYGSGVPFSKENVGDRIFVKRDGFELIIPKDNKDERGYFFVNSIQGHDCYSNNSLSTHIYHILDGKGEFIIDDKIVPVEAGSMVVIPPNVTFYYSGRMLMQLEMTPNFVEEHDHCIEKVSYTTNVNGSIRHH